MDRVKEVRYTGFEISSLSSLWASLIMKGEKRSDHEKERQWTYRQESRAGLQEAGGGGERLTHTLAVQEADLKADRFADNSEGHVKRSASKQVGEDEAEGEQEIPDNNSQIMKLIAGH